MSKVKIPKANKGYGYVGVWSYNNTLGWFMPPHIVGKQDLQYPDITDNSNANDERFFLCEITVKPLKDKLGRPITKIPKKRIP